MVQPRRTPSHCWSSSGRVKASNTRGRAASKVRIMAISRSDGVVSFRVWFGISAPPVGSAWGGSGPVHGPGQQPVEGLEALAPVLAVVLEPGVGLGQGRRFEAGRPPLGIARPGDEPGPFQDLE